jgi:hypothetical protein
MVRHSAAECAGAERLKKLVESIVSLEIKMIRFFREY